MRTETFWMSSDDLLWEGPEDSPVKSKLLNGSRDSEENTILAKSEPRPPSSRRGQFHSADEEFFVRRGEFTFDGERWFAKRGYAFYPRGCIHGTNVHVRGGYEMLLRYNGPRSLNWVESPNSDYAYFADETPLTNDIVELAVATLPEMKEGNISVSQLRQSQNSDQGATLLDAEFSSSTVLTLCCDDFMEIFVTEASNHSAESRKINSGYYRFSSGGVTAIPFSGHGRLSMVVFHGRPLKVVHNGAIV